MNKMLIPSKNIKYLKLFIISPYYEIIVNLAYIIFFFLLAFYILEMGSEISNSKITSLIETKYHKDEFIKIKTDQDFLNYIDFLVNELYTYDPSKKLNFMIPLGSIRLKKYTHKMTLCPFEEAPKCSDCKYNNKKINNNYTLVACTITELTKLYEESDFHCGVPYRKSYSNNPSQNLNSIYITLTRDYEGKYGYYDLVNDGVNHDFTIDNYNKDNISSFIHDQQLKCKEI